MKEIIPLDPKLKEIEEEVIQYLIDSNLFYSSSTIFRRILGHFITRKVLTQEMLKKLTDLSAGKISEEINKLHEMGFISRTRKSSTDPYIYTMDSIDIAFINDAINTLKTALDWEAHIKQIYGELEKNQDTMETLNGYNDIVRFLRFIMPLMAFTKGEMDKIEELKVEFENRI